MGFENKCAMASVVLAVKVAAQVAEFGRDNITGILDLGKNFFLQAFIGHPKVGTDATEAPHHFAAGAEQGHRHADYPLAQTAAVKAEAIAGNSRS